MAQVEERDNREGQSRQELQKRSFERATSLTPKN
jgi:hypothetical protein